MLGSTGPLPLSSTFPLQNKTFPRLWLVAPTTHQSPRCHRERRPTFLCAHHNLSADTLLGFTGAPRYSKERRLPWVKPLLFVLLQKKAILPRSQKVLDSSGPSPWSSWRAPGSCPCQPKRIHNHCFGFKKIFHNTKLLCVSIHVRQSRVGAEE